MTRVLITGANRGIGLAFVTHYLHAGATVFAACRTPESAAELHALHAAHAPRLHLLPLDVADAASIDAAAAQVASLTDGLERLVNNAAVFHQTPFGSLDFETSLNTFRVNAVAPALLTQALWGLLQQGDRAVILNISSNRGSVSGQQDTKLYDYAASKAAMNSYTRSLAAQAALHGMSAVMIDPGWVQTRMGGMDADLAPAETVAGMVRIIENLTPSQNGSYLNWDGSPHPW